MALSLSFTRPKLATANTVNTTLATKPTIETASAFRLPVVIESVDPPLINESGATYTSGDPTINTTETDNYRVGDAIDSSGGDFAGAGDFPAGTVVVSKVDGTSVTVDQNPTASGTGIDIQPPAIDVTVAIAELSFSTTGNSLVLSPTFYFFDGSAAAEGSTVDNYDNLTANEASNTIVLSNQTLNLDDIYTAVRVPRTN